MAKRVLLLTDLQVKKAWPDKKDSVFLMALAYIFWLSQAVASFWRFDYKHSGRSKKIVKRQFL